MKIWEVRTNRELDPSLSPHTWDRAASQGQLPQHQYLRRNTLSVERANTMQINMVGGIHIRMAPIVPTGILHGWDANGCFTRNHTNARNSKIILKQYKKFSAATISWKLSHDSKSTSEAENRIPIRGVPLRDLLPKNSSSIPRSAISKSWKESLFISATYIPIFNIAETPWIHYLKQTPPIILEIFEKFPSVHNSQLTGTAPIKRGKKYTRTTNIKA